MPQKVSPRRNDRALQPIDRLDLRILSALQENGRMSNRDLANQVGLSDSPCLVRVKRLEHIGLISRYMAVIELRKLVQTVTFISLLYLRESDMKAARALEAFLQNLPELTELFDVNGECDYIARFVCRNTEDYSNIARALLDTPQYQVRQINSYIVLRQVHPYRGVNLSHLLAERTVD